MRATLSQNICYTDLVYGRFNKKLKTSYSNEEIQQLVLDIIQDSATQILENGKNYYLNSRTHDLRLTVNKNNYRLITADPYDENKLVADTPKPKAQKTSEWYQEKNGKAEHLVYLNKEAQELDKFLAGTKTMVIRGAAGRKSPLGGRAKAGDAVYFVETGGDLTVSHRGVIKEVVESEKMTPTESAAFIETYQKELNLSPKQYERWNGKKYLAVYEIHQLEAIEPFTYRREKNMDDWVITEDIGSIKA